MDFSISVLNLSPLAYIFLVANGIKSMAFLMDFSAKELSSLRMPYDSFSSREDERLIVDEILAKLEAFSIDKASLERKPLEVKISELHLNKGEYRLQTNGVYTVGKLATLSERNILNMRAIGAGTLAEIKDKLQAVHGFAFELSDDEMACIGMDEKEKEFYFKQKEYVENLDSERKEQKKLRLQESRENATNRNTVLNYSIVKLGIPEPVFQDDSDGIITAKLTLKELLNYLSYKRISNASEVIAAFKSLNIPGLYFGMSRGEIGDLRISSGKIKELEALMRSVEIRREEESFLRAKFLEEDNARRQTILQEQIVFHNEGLRQQAQIKEGMIKKLESLLEENERLKAINDSLDSRIDELSSKLGIPSTSKTGDDSYAK